jgi:uncharacterized protein YlaN (UPF0358 family)
LGTPWGWINAKKEAEEHSTKVWALQRRINKAIVLLKVDNPDIQQVIEILEEK